MPLPTVDLDDRHFQDIVDQAKTLIPQYCPEWTDHNVSDPGVTLIELFAWMTDLVLYRVNQTPDKMYVKFLEMIGVRLEPPRAARAPITFYLSAPQPGAVTIPERTEVATVRTESHAAITFSTEADLAIRPPELIGAFTRDIARRSEEQWTEHDLSQIDLPGQRVLVFATNPVPGDALYLAFRSDLSHHVLALVMQCDLAGGAGVDPANPPIIWEAWHGGSERWVRCDVESDTTGGFNTSGEMVLHLPALSKVTFREVPAYWVRCRLLEPEDGTSTYQVSPEIDRLRLESRGATTMARHATTIFNEVLGRSEGTPGQRWRLLHAPVLAREPGKETLTVEMTGSSPQQWVEVDDFGDSGPDDSHFTLDGSDGTITLGPALLQPDGTVYRFGAVPPRGSQLRFSRYQFGGGVGGNVPKSMLSILKSSIPYVARVTNRAQAVGGRDAQSLDDAKLRAPQTLRTRTRAVTADDFETLARQVAGVERARCLAPGAQPGAALQPHPGEIQLAVLPQVDQPRGYIAPDRLTLSAELKQAVESFLNERRLLGTRLDVQPAHFTWVSITARIRLPERADPGRSADIRRRVETELYRYLNPYVGGPDGTGWPFGRDLHVSELYALLQRISGVEFVDDLRIAVRDTASGTATPHTAPRLVLPPNGLICSDIHHVSKS